MPYTGEAKNIMVDAIGRGTAPSSSAAYVGLLSADAGKSVTAVGSTGVFTSTAHGYSAGDLVVLSALTGGSGFVAGRLYRVLAPAANTFTLSATVGGAAITGGSDLTAGTVTRLVELSGGSPVYARIATAFTAPVAGVNDDSTSHSVNVPPSTTVSYVGYWSAVTAGVLQAVASVTPEVFAGQGTYAITDSRLDLNATA